MRVAKVSQVLWPVTEDFVIGTSWSRAKRKNLRRRWPWRISKASCYSHKHSVGEESQVLRVFRGFVGFGIVPECYLWRRTVFREFKILRDFGCFSVGFELLRSCCLRRRCVLWESCSSMCFFNRFWRLTGAMQLLCAQTQCLVRAWNSPGWFIIIVLCFRSCEDLARLALPTAWLPIYTIGTPILASDASWWFTNEQFYVQFPESI